MDPLNLWETPPFQPEVRDGRIYARGASDMKGNMLESILGVEALLQGEGKLPVNVKFFLEGQEEIGSPQLPAFVAANRDLLAADLVLNADGGQPGEDQPGLLIGLKGGCGIQIDVRGANTDLHSGLFGGAVANPIHALVRILDSMRAPDGTITVEGFFDDVLPLTERDRADIGAIPFDEEGYKASIGVPDTFGEPGYTTLERAWARPTLEINGIWGGFQGEGSKTVLPNEAHAKITCRLVPNQDPETIRDLLTRHVERHAPPGVIVDVRPLPFLAKPYLIPADHWGNQIAGKVLTDLYGKEPWFVRMGGSVAVTETFLTELGAYSVGFGFGMDDERFHAPNEFLRLSSFDKAQNAWVAILRRLGEAQPS